jgi:mRNA interferase HigB
MMRVVSRTRIEAFVQRHPQAATSLDHWYRVVKDARWRSLAEVKQVYPQADLVGRRTVFNVAGNRYRVITRINYQRQTLYIGYVLTHAEYTKGKWQT